MKMVKRNLKLKLNYLMQIGMDGFDEKEKLKLLIDLLNSKFKIKIKMYYENNQLGFEAELLNLDTLKLKFYNERNQLKFEGEISLTIGEKKKIIN